MIQNHIKIALRNLLKNRFFSAVNIFGLAMSMSVSLLILLLIRNAKSYDQFHPSAERVFRINTDALRKDGDSEKYATTPFPLGAAAATALPQVEAMTRFSNRVNGEAKLNGKILSVRGAFAEPNFFEIFGFKMLEGNAATALAEPMQMILTRETADRFFPRESAMGKTLSLGGFGDFQISGVLAEPQGKTHLEFDALVSATSIPILEKNGSLGGELSKDWNDYYSTYTYIRLRPDAKIEDVEPALAAISKTEYANLTLESRSAGYNFYLQPLTKITPGTNLSNDIGRGMPAMLLLVLSILAGVIMLSACFNYTSLTLARAVTRAREIGVRKVVGASRWQVVRQLLSEAVVTSLLALGVGWVLMKLVQPGFNSLRLTESIDVEVREDPTTLLWFLAFAIGTGLVAGLLPALAMSRLDPTAMLQKLGNLRLFRHLGLRKTLLVSQFTISLLFLIFVTVLNKQINFMMTMEYGFKTSQIINVDLQGENFEKISAALAAVPGVEKISATSHNMGTWQDSKDDVRVRESDEKIGVRDYSVDENFLENLDLEFVAGQNFPTDAATGNEKFAIVNEKFLENFQLGTPADALGKEILVGDSTRLQICGVLKNFFFKPAVYALEPLLLRNAPARFSILNLKLAAGTDPVALQVNLQKAWATAVPERSLEAEFFDEAVRSSYVEMKDLLKIFSFFTLLGIVIAALGLLGMAVFTVESRMKEVSLRKVLGASPRDLVVLLSRNFFLLLGIAVVVAAPIGWFLGQQFLQLFAQRISGGLSILLPGVLILLGVGALTIGSQTFRAAFSAPVRSLRND